jgi:hypothetical protein
MEYQCFAAGIGTESDLKMPNSYWKSARCIDPVKIRELQRRQNAAVCGRSERTCGRLEQSCELQQVLWYALP